MPTEQASFVSIYTVSIKQGLRTTDCGLRTVGLRTTDGGLRTGYKTRTQVWRFCTAAMLHGTNNVNVLNYKEHFFP